MNKFDQEIINEIINAVDNGIHVYYVDKFHEVVKKQLKTNKGLAFQYAVFNKAKNEYYPLFGNNGEVLVCLYEIFNEDDLDYVNEHNMTMHDLFILKMKSKYNQLFENYSNLKERNTLLSKKLNNVLNGIKSIIQN